MILPWRDLLFLFLLIVLGVVELSYPKSLSWKPHNFQPRITITGRSLAVFANSVVVRSAIGGSP
jgi:hypothetical protein